MTDREALIQALTQLDPAALEEVVNTAYRQRDHTRTAAPASPSTRATPEQIAQWLAQRHLSTDAAIERAVYLPVGAPGNEIRLLEVNRHLRPSGTDAIEPLDFTPEWDLPYRVFVADITADQWDHAQENPGAILPAGWELGDHKIFKRG